MGNNIQVHNILHLYTYMIVSRYYDTRPYDCCKASILLIRQTYTLYYKILYSSELQNTVIKIIINYYR